MSRLRSNGSSTLPILAPPLFIVGYTVGYFFLVHLVPLEGLDVFVALVFALTVMVLGMLASARMR